MARTVGIDFGTKRIGVAHTDPLGISVQGHGTYSADVFFKVFEKYFMDEEVEKVVIGRPSKPSKAFEEELESFIEKLKSLDSEVEIVFHDEDYTSKDAVNKLIELGYSKSQRQNKSAIDQVSAIMILQDFLGMAK